jgi:ribosomal protein S18 acetylase RimI-like enzyme
MTFTFKPIDLNDPKDIAAAALFRRDAFVLSTGNEEEWIRQSDFDGGRYIEWLQKHHDNPEALIVQVFDQNQRVGQIEARIKDGNDKRYGYVHLYYLVPSYRNKGLGMHLETHAQNHFKSHGIETMQLGVYPTNPQAIAFYAKQGWSHIGDHPKAPSARLMQKNTTIGVL